MTNVTELNKEARELAQKIVNNEIDRLELVEQQKELKSQIELLIEQGADTSYDCPNGSVFQDSTIKFSIPDGLKEEILPHVKNPEKLSQDIIEEFIKTSPSLNKKGVKAMHEGNIDLENLIVQTKKLSIKIKIS